MVEAGILPKDNRVELLEGLIVPMTPIQVFKGTRSLCCGIALVFAIGLTSGWVINLDCCEK